MERARARKGFAQRGRLTTTVALPRAEHAEPWYLERVAGHVARRDGTGVVIGIVDTGVDATHPELAGRLEAFARFSEDGARLDGPPDDPVGHGTSVARLAAGARHGLAPHARLVVAAVSTRADGSTTTAQLRAGIEWLLSDIFAAGRASIDVLNISFGLVIETNELTGRMIYNPDLLGVIEAAQARGVAVVAAVGNHGTRGAGFHLSPANYPGVLSVGATDKEGYVLEHSCWGVGPSPAGPQYPIPRICAPGEQVIAHPISGAPMSGTSFATPIVAGVAAHRISVDPSLRGRPEALFAAMVADAVPVRPSRRGNLGGAGEVRL